MTSDKVDNSADAEAPAASTPPPRRRRRIVWRGLIVALLLAVAFVAAMPYLASSSPTIRSWLLSVAFRRLHGTVAVEKLSLAWPSPVSVVGVTVTPTDAPQLLTIDNIDGDRPLWKLLTSRDLGRFRIERPAFTIAVGPEGSNLARLVGPRPDKAGLPPGTAVALSIVEGSVSVSDSRSEGKWGTEHLNLELALQPAAAPLSGVTELVGKDLQLLDHSQITPAMCEDVLKYVAPVLARATRAGGAISLRLDNVQWPLGHPEQAKLAGEMAIHQVVVGPSPVLRELLGIIPRLQPPESLQLMADSTVKFDMHDGRVYHEGLAVGLPEVRSDLVIKSHGSVGLDESLDLTVDIPLPTDLLGTGPLLKALSKQTLTLHIGGTLSHPKLERNTEDGQTANLLGQTLGELLQPSAESGPSAAEESIKLLLERIEQRRQQREQNATDPAAEPGSPEPRRPLRRLLRRLGEAATTPPEASPEPAGSEGAPSQESSPPPVDGDDQ